MIQGTKMKSFNFRTLGLGRTKVQVLLPVMLALMCISVSFSAATTSRTSIVRNSAMDTSDYWWLHGRGYNLARDSSTNTYASLVSVADNRTGDFGLFTTIVLTPEQQAELMGSPPSAASFTLGGYFRAKDLVIPTASSIAGFYVDVVWANGTRTYATIKNVNSGTYGWTFVPLAIQANGVVPLALYLWVLTRNQVTGVLDVDHIALYQGAVTSDTEHVPPAGDCLDPVICTGQRPSTCSNDKLRIEVLDDNTLIEDGQVKRVSISLGASVPRNERALVQLKPAAGIVLSETTLRFNGPDDPESYIVRIRTVPGAQSANEGSVLDKAPLVQVELLHPQITFCSQQIALQRRVVNSCSGHGLGDPHMKTLDDATYDFQIPGYFNYFKSKELSIQVYQEKCACVVPLRGYEASPSCYQGVAIAYGESTVRLMLNAEGRLVYSKGSEFTKGLSLEKLAGKGEGYRVFVTSDESTYVDVNKGLWLANYAYLNVALRVSPYFKDASTQGLLGNWNGDAADDERDQTKLAAKFLVDNSSNLFTCVGGCRSHVKSLGEDALSFLNSFSANLKVPLLHRGYEKVLDRDILTTPLSPPRTIESLQAAAKKRLLMSPTELEHRRRLEASIDLKTAKAVCSTVIRSISTCEKYVKDVDNFVNNLCAADVELINDITVVDAVKLAYLRECRRVVDGSLSSNIGSGAEKVTLVLDAQRMTLGSTTSCPNMCSGRGECLPAGCKCSPGYSGLSCETDLLALVTSPTLHAT